MHYVYVLRSQLDGTWYVGETSDLKRRLWEHNHAKSRYTKSKLPWTLMYYEAFPTELAAKSRERKLKLHGKGLSELKRRILLG